MSRSAPVCVVELAAAFDAEFLGHGDLHVTDAAAPPQRLEQRIAETQRQQVLHRLLAEVMIDAIDLALLRKDRTRRSRLMWSADARSCPGGFSSTTRDFGCHDPRRGRIAAGGENRLGAVDRKNHRDRRSITVWQRRDVATDRKPRASGRNPQASAERGPARRIRPMRRPCCSPRPAPVAVAAQLCEHAAHKVGQRAGKLPIARSPHPPKTGGTNGHRLRIARSPVPPNSTRSKSGNCSGRRGTGPWKKQPGLFI